MRYVRPSDFPHNPRGPIDFLDPVVAHYSGVRYTFTEEDALSEVWGSGEDTRLREDPRFWEIDGTDHFQLSHHSLANELLVDGLWQGTWEGQEVQGQLGRLDDLNPGSFHVFCPADPRVSEQEGRMALVIRPLVKIAQEVRGGLDDVSDRLLVLHRDSASPMTTQGIRELVLRLDGDITIGEGLDVLESWLRQQSEWSEVAKGLWLPTELVPSPSAFEVLRVSRVRNTEANEQLEPGLAEANDAAFSAEQKGGTTYYDPPVERHPDRSVSWTHTLRTVHIQNSYLPVPTAARFRYPRFVGRGNSVVALRAIAFESGDEGLAWLDRESNRFFGQLLAEIVEWEEAGRKLHIKWQPESIVIKLGEIDEEVLQEEQRHIDPEALYDLRLGRGESYRQTLASILREHETGLDFRKLYEELTRRQGHHPSRGSIRAVLSQSPCFLKEGAIWRWQYAPSAAQSLRRRLVLGSLGLNADDANENLGDLAGAVAQAARRSTKPSDIE